MTPRTFAETALKLWAVTMLVTAAMGVVGLVAQVVLPIQGADSSWRVVGAWNFIYLCLSIIVGVALLRYARPLAERLAPPDDPSQSAQSPIALEALAFGCLGLYFLVMGLREGAGIVFVLATRPAIGGEGLAYLWRDSPQKLVDAIVQIIAGIALFAGRGRLSSLWQRMRTYSPSPS